MNTKWKQSESITALAPALIAAQTAGLFVCEGKDNPQTRSRYADLTSIWIAIQPILAEHKIAVLQPLGCIRREHDKFILALETILIHKSGQWISCESEILVTQNDKLSVAWWAGSAQTYGRRYALVSMLGIITGEDDDGVALQRGLNRPEPQPAKKSQNLPDVTAEWSAYAQGGWRGYRLPDGMTLGELDDIALRKLVRVGIETGEHVDPLKGFLWDWIGGRLDALNEFLSDALFARGWTSFAAASEWTLDEFRKAGTLLLQPKPEGASAEKA
jgi:hypothetical protein